MTHAWGKCPKCGDVSTFCIIHKVCIHYECWKKTGKK